VTVLIVSRSLHKGAQEYAPVLAQATPTASPVPTEPAVQATPQPENTLESTPAPSVTPAEALESPFPIEGPPSLAESPAVSMTPPPPTPAATPEPSASPTPDGAKAGGHLNVLPDSEATPPPVVANRQEEDATRKEVLARIVLVLVGYADLKGNETKNLEISRLRAESLVKLLQSRTKISNLMRAVGLGGSDIFDKTNPDKNRAVEIWVVRR